MVRLLHSVNAVPRSNATSIFRKIYIGMGYIDQSQRVDCDFFDTLPHTFHTKTYALHSTRCSLGLPPSFLCMRRCLIW